MRSEAFARLKVSFEYHAGLIEIPDKTRKFIYTHFNFLLFTTIPGVFINTFFFKQDGKISTVAIYTAITCFGTALVMHVSSQISLKKSPVYVLRIGVAFFNIFYITLLLLQRDAVKFMILLAVINAIASGFYWQGYNEMMRLCTNDGIFDRTVSLMGLAGAVVTMFIPILSGILITNCPGQVGYTIIFVISFLSSLYTTYLTTGLEKSKINGKSNLNGVYRYIFTNRSMLAANLAELVRGIRNSAFPLFLNIIFFKLVSNEALLGINNMLCGLASILAYILAGKIIRPGNRLKCILISSNVSTFLFLSLFFSMNPAMIFLLAIVNAFLCAYIDNPAISVFYSLFEKPIEGITFSQIMSVHEIFFAIGRVIGLVLLIAFSQNDFMLAILMLILNVSIALSWAIYRFGVNPAKKDTDACTVR